MAALTGLPASGMAQASPQAAQKAQTSGNWKQLKSHEKKALAPLAARWGELTETQRSKWLAIAQHFDQLSPAEQQVMQTRMAEWVALNPVQRNQARLHFNTVQSLSKDEKKSRWDEYQNLSEAEKRKLSAGVLTTSKTAAPSPRPSASDRLVQPALRTLPAAALPPRTPIDQKTLLPIPASEQPSSRGNTPPPTSSAREASAS
ncbi:DUF3106 domain-containing protein [Limnohabitans sp.]|uniref:DUF3106 domain-containing protein n=1 Tax=Limnohabitans sp. TaxID=1907725 RepID=UPI0035B103EB